MNVGSVALEHQAGLMNIRNNTVFANYDKFYQNIFPGAVNADQTLVSLSGYNNATDRQNVFNQTDVTGVFATGSIRHTILMGAEFGRQHSVNFRNTAYFDNGATSVNVPFAYPTIRSSAIFRQAQPTPTTTQPTTSPRHTYRIRSNSPGTSRLSLASDTTASISTSITTERTRT